MAAKFQLAAALGLDLYRVLGDIVINVHVDEPPSVTVKMHLDDERVGKLAELLKTYKLMEDVPEGE
jgi:hypothetical protein